MSLPELADAGCPAASAARRGRRWGDASAAYAECAAGASRFAPRYSAAAAAIGLRTGKRDVVCPALVRAAAAAAAADFDCDNLGPTFAYAGLCLKLDGDSAGAVPLLRRGLAAHEAELAAIRAAQRADQLFAPPWYVEGGRCC